MSYPEDRLVIKLEIAPAADRSADPDTYPWQDITADWSARVAIEITYGGQDEQAETNSELTFDVRNIESTAGTGAYAGMDGRYTDDNPLSDLYQLLMNCPVRLTINAGDGSGDSVRTVQYVGSMVDEWIGMSPNLVITHFTCGGLFRQMTQGKEVMSALRRTSTNPAASDPPVYYFPLEASTGVGTDSVSTMKSEGSSASVMRFGDHGVDLTAIDGPLGSDTVGVWPFAGNTFPVDGFRTTIGASFRAALAMPATGYWAVAFSFRATAPATITGHHVWRLEMQDNTGNGFHVYFADVWGGGSTLLYGQVSGTDAIGGISYTIPNMRMFDGAWHHVVVTQQQVSGDYTNQLWFDGVLASAFTFTAASIAYPAYVAGPFADSFTGDSATVNNDTAMSIAHLQFHSDSSLSPADLYRAHLGFDGELAHERIERLSNEESVPVTVAGATSSALGPQPISHVVALYREAAETDRGILTDHLGRVGYRTFSDLCNQSATLTVDAANRRLFAPFAPTTDDAKTRNDITARARGTFARVTADSATIARQGHYAATIQPSVGDVAQLPGQAGWTVWEGTQPGKRYPTWTIDLLRAPELIPTWIAHELGDRATITNPPRAHSPLPVDLMSRGVQETIAGGHGPWNAVINAVRYDPFDSVMSIENGTGNRSRLSGGGTQVAVAASSAATSLSVFELGSEDAAVPVRWIDSATYPSLFPFTMTTLGERISVSAINTIARDAFTGRTDVASWGTPTVGPSNWAVTGTAADWSTLAGVGRIIPTATGSDRFATLASPGSDNLVACDIQFTTLPLTGIMRAGVLVRWASTTSYCLCELTLSPAGVLTIRLVQRSGAQTVLTSATLLPDILPAAGTWFRIIGQAVGSTLRARAWRRDRTTSAGATFTNRQAPVWQVEAETTVLAGSNVGAYGRNETAVTVNTLSFDNWRLDSPQTFVVTRGLDDFSKALPVGSPMALYRPAVYSL